MTKDEMINKIYEVIADKTLSFGCILDLNIDMLANGYYENEYRKINEESNNRDYAKILMKIEYFKNEFKKQFGKRLVWIGYNSGINSDMILFNANKYVQGIEITPKRQHKEPLLEYIEYISQHKDFGVKIIGHPVMIGDVLDWMQSYNMLIQCTNLLGIWNNKREPIQNQSEYCITFIYNLIASHVPKKESN